MNIKQCETYAPKWHILEFKGYSYEKIAHEYGCDVATIEKFIRWFRRCNNVPSPAEKKLQHYAERQIEPLDAREKRMLAVILGMASVKLTNAVSDVIGSSGFKKFEAETLLHMLAAKQYIDMRKAKNGRGQAILPLLNLSGEAYSEERDNFDVGKDGIKKYRKPMYAEGYGYKQSFGAGVLDNVFMRTGQPRKKTE